MSGLSELAERFEMFLSKINSPFPLGIEIRNFDFLQRNNLSHVYLQGYFMPPIFESFNKFKDKILSLVVIRLHGPDRKEIEEQTGGNWNQIISPKDDELPKVVNIINYFSSKNIDVYLNVNNHYEGSAPLTIQKINRLLKN
jgi:uncharacterized protein YecE (DUF72 family)